MIATLLHWFRGRRLDADLRRLRHDLALALRYHRNITAAISDMRAMVCQLEHESALHRMEAGSGFRAKTSSIVSKWRLWA